ASAPGSPRLTGGLTARRSPGGRLMRGLRGRPSAACRAFLVRTSVTVCRCALRILLFDFRLRPEIGVAARSAIGAQFLGLSATRRLCIFRGRRGTAFLFGAPLRPLCGAPLPLLDFEGVLLHALRARLRG